jgi:hypothetical protein
MPEPIEQKINRPNNPSQSAPMGQPPTVRLDSLVGQLLAAQVAQRGVDMTDSTIRKAIQLAKRTLSIIDGE